MKKQGQSGRDDGDDFWRSVERSAASVQSLPAWMKVGLVVDRTNFVAAGSDNPVSRPEKKLASWLAPIFWMS